jgi:hypothetical protein
MNAVLPAGSKRARKPVCYTADTKEGEDEGSESGDREEEDEDEDEGADAGAGAESGGEAVQSTDEKDLPQLSEYEKMRLRNIQRNEAQLRSLGLLPVVDATTSVPAANANGRKGGKKNNKKKVGADDEDEAYVDEELDRSLKRRRGDEERGLGAEGVLMSGQEPSSGVKIDKKQGEGFKYCADGHLVEGKIVVEVWQKQGSELAINLSEHGGCGASKLQISSGYWLQGSLSFPPSAHPSAHQPISPSTHPPIHPPFLPPLLSLSYISPPFLALVTLDIAKRTHAYEEWDGYGDDDCAGSVN